MSEPTRHEPARPGAPNLSAEQLRRHDAAVAAGQPGYFDPVTGLFVMTSAYLAARGHCCDTGCRHCPYRGRR